MALVPRRDLVVIGGSAGGVEALVELVSALPGDLAATVLVVVHTSRDQPGLLPDLLNRAGPLQARFPKHGDRLRHGEILVAPPDAHLLVRGTRARVTRGPRENGFRPAIDPLFRTAAESFGPRVIGVVLSGALDDGTAGLLEIKRNGGLALVQHAGEALFPSMPLAAIRGVDVDHVLPVGEIAVQIAATCGRDRGELVEPRSATPPPTEDPAEEGADGLRDGSLPGPPSAFTCPECGGALWEIQEGRVLSYRCHVGHAFGESSLLAHQASEVESALWMALRTLREAAALRERMARHAIESGLEGLAQGYLDAAKMAEQKAEQIRRVLTHAEPIRTGPGAVGRAEEGGT